MIAIGGALITIVGNIIFIPKYGFVACAWLTLLVYFLMCIAALVIGNHYFKVPYAYVKLAALIILSILLWQLFGLLNCHISAIWLSVCTKILLLSLLMLIIWLLHPKGKKA
jgi:O-antigen/teichoic acid export membrane protein